MPSLPLIKKNDRAARAVLRVDHPAGSHLRSNEGEDLTGRIDSKHASSGPDGYTLELTRNLDKPSGAGVESPDAVVGKNDDPDAIPAGRDLIAKAYLIPRAVIWVVAKQGGVGADRPHVIHPYGDLEQGTRNLDKLLLTKTVVVDLGTRGDPP